MNLDVVTDILVSANLGVLGTNLFQDHMPDDVSLGLMVKLPLSGIPVDTYLPEYYRLGKVQVIVRSASYDVGKALADQVRRAMTISMQTNYLDDQGKLLMRIISMRPTTLPIVYPRTPGNLTEWSINFEASYFMPDTKEGTGN